MKMNKKYCFTDLHGDYKLWKQIQEWADESDKLVFLGDACDRGVAGIQILTEMREDPRVKVVYGNHEDFLLNIGYDILEGNYSMIKPWVENGGGPTCQAFLSLTREEQINLLEWLKDIPVVLNYTNPCGQQIILTHAGFSPDKQPSLDKSPLDYIWDRDHLQRLWPQDKEYENLYIIHGHTPVQYLYHYGQAKMKIDEYGIEEIAIYGRGHKIDLDLATFETGKIVLFDLDELKVAKTFYNNDKVWERVNNA